MLHDPRAEGFVKGELAKIEGPKCCIAVGLQELPLLKDSNGFFGQVTMRLASFDSGRFQVPGKSAGLLAGATLVGLDDGAGWLWIAMMKLCSQVVTRDNLRNGQLAERYVREFGVAEWLQGSERICEFICSQTFVGYDLVFLEHWASGLSIRVG